MSLLLGERKLHAKFFWSCSEFLPAWGRYRRQMGTFVDKTQQFTMTSFFKKVHFRYIYRLKNILIYGEEGNPLNEAI